METFGIIYGNKEEILGVVLNKAYPKILTKTFLRKVKNIFKDVVEYSSVTADEYFIWNVYGEVNENGVGNLFFETLEDMTSLNKTIVDTMVAANNLHQFLKKDALQQMAKMEVPDPTDKFITAREHINDLLNNGRPVLVECLK